MIGFTGIELCGLRNHRDSIVEGIFPWRSSRVRISGRTNLGRAGYVLALSGVDCRCQTAGWMVLRAFVPCAHFVEFETEIRGAFPKRDDLDR